MRCRGSGGLEYKVAAGIKRLVLTVQGSGFRVQGVQGGGVGFKGRFKLFWL